MWRITMKPFKAYKELKMSKYIEEPKGEEVKKKKISATKVKTDKLPEVDMNENKFRTYKEFKMGKYIK
jgi:hypothetical protein